MFKLIDIIILITILTGSGITGVLVSYFSHRSTTRETAKEYHRIVYRIVFEDFLELFSSVQDWERKIEHRYSFYSTASHGGKKLGYVHAGIISFNEDLFVFRNVFVYARFLLWSLLNKNRKKEIEELDYKDHKVRLELNKSS